MFFSVIRLNMDITPRNILDTIQKEYGVHQLIWDIFADTPERRRDFLFRYEIIKGIPTFFTVSERPPANVTKIWRVVTKEYNPQYSPGQFLSFHLRVNPIRSKRDKTGRQHRHDVVMDERNRLKKQNKQINEADIIQECGEQWLRSRSNGLGFVIKDSAVRAGRYRQHNLFKNNGNNAITFSTLDFNGILTVTKPATFEKFLFNGVGPAKGFGCGLMLVREV